MHEFDIDQGVGAFGRRGQCGIRSDRAKFVFTEVTFENSGIAIRAAIQVVIALIAFHLVGTGAAIDHVVAGTGYHDVVTGTCINNIVPALKVEILGLR